MAKTTRNTGKRATAAGRGELRARKAAVAKTHDAKLRKLKPARPAPRKGKPSLPPETASLKRQLKTARLQQQASAEILRAVANASGDVARPLQQIAETTARLFGAPSVSIQLAEGGEFTREYRVGAIAQRIGSAYPRSNIRVGGRNLPGTVVFENRQIHIPDLDRLDPSMSDFPGLPHARAGGARTVCGTPLRCEGKAIGALIIFRNRLLPFTDDELALQQSFADQAVIAIENARLFNETKEALARQTATSDILRVISQSPTDVQPVFDAIVLAARGLLGREMAGILRCDDTNFWPAAIAGPEGLSPILNPAPMAINPDANFPSRAIVSKKNLHFPDWSTIDLPEYERNIRDMYGVNSTLYLPLLRYEECIGVLLLAGSQPGMFGENEIALAESFRDQALIAIENARLFNETKEALERQTATADVLRIISRSVAHAAPVFDTILESCQRLFNPYDAAVYLVEGDKVRGVARRGPGAGDWGADSMPLEGSSTGVAIAQGQPVHFPDLADKADLPEDKRAVLKETGGMTVLYAPMISQDSGVGSLVVTRRPKKPFTETEIDFIQSFADQAVIAIENARLFDEVEAKTRDLSEALEQQTATSEVLAVISRSPSDLNPVLEAISDTAARLCGSEQTMFFRYDGTVFRILASWNFPPEVHEMLECRPLMPGHPSAIGRAGASLKPVCIPDVLADPDYGLTGEQNRARYRATLAVPLLREGRLVGALSLNRSEPGAFTEKQIELVATFADQAVIAIENTRLFNETKEALEQQKASADILSVISSSVADTRPVFDKILSSIEHLFGADERLVLLAGEDDLLHIGAVHGPNSERAHALFPVPLQGSASEVAIRERRLVTHANVFDDPDVPPVLRETARRFGKNYSMAVAPLVWEDRAIGSIFVARTSMKAFDGKECALLCTFADQAVIAIQNARLFKETREALERQTATADILKVIASSPSDVQPVFEAIAASAKKLIGGFSAVVQRFIGDDLHLAAFTPTNPEADATLQASFPTPISQFPVFLLVRDGKTVEFTDTEAEDVPRLNRDLARLRGYRSMLFTPLMNNGAPIGMISVTRKEPGSFADHHVQLVRTFADQAVIAIENVRLFDEVKAKTADLSESLQQQIATADVLKVISRSAFDLQAVLTTLVRSALNLCNAPIGTFFLREGDVLRLATQVGCTPELVQYFHDNPIPLNQSSGAGRAFSTGRVVHFPDVLADPDYRLSEVQRLGDYRSLLAVPLLREQETIGVFSLSRTRPEPFSQRQIDLVTTFADQAVIAIENARLFDEVQAKTRDLTEALTYQTGSGNILKAIASSPTDVGPVLAAIAENAAELCDAYDAAVLLKVGDDLHFSAHHGSIPIGLERWPINRNWTAGRAFLDQKPVHIHDLRADENSDFSDGRELSLRMGHRSILSVPLLRENDSIGAIVLRRKEVHPFSDKQIALLQTFADQAVIAISNVRLFEQVQERTRELSQSLDELRTAQDRLVQTEKLASLGQLTAGIAHEIKNPLNFVNNFSALSAELIDELDETLAPAPLDQKMRGDVGELTQMLKSNLEKVVQHGKRADSIVKNMLLHSREGSGEQRPADINALLDESLNLAYHGARAEKPEFNITLRRDLDPDAGTINVFPQEITRAFINLISNGFYAASKRKAENGEADFEPVLSAATKNLGNHIEIRIRDNGTGIPPEVKDKIFNPFFTTKPSGEGTGLGLSMSHDIIVKQHGGSIDVETEPGLFTEFKIVLPRPA